MSCLAEFAEEKQLRFERLQEHIEDHTAALDTVLKFLKDTGIGVISNQVTTLYRCYSQANLSIDEARPTV